MMNIICGSIYRHPHESGNYNNFLEYMEAILNNLSAENKCLW